MVTEVGKMDENHRRALRGGLIVVEKLLHEMIDDLTQNVDNSGSILYSRVEDVDQISAKTLLDIVMSMLGIIRQIKEKFELVPSQESVRAQVYGRLSEIWTILEDLRPEKLEAYGRMNGDDMELLRPYILRLLSMLDDIFRLLRSTSRKSTYDQYDV
jgi:hypothetical protein